MADNIPQNRGSEEEEHGELYQPNILSQFPLLNGYTHLVLGFQLEPGTSPDAVVTALCATVDKLVVQIPWLGGHVIQHFGMWKPAPWPTDSLPNEIVRVKHCEDMLPTMEQLLGADAPIGMLDGEILAPFPGLLQPHGIDGFVPIVAIQVNFVRGGLVLNLSLQHNVVDATGILQFIRLLATVLNDRKIPQAELNQANRDCSQVVPLIPPSEPVKDHSYLRRPPEYNPGLPSSPPRWCYFKLATFALPMLRKMASSPTAVQISEQDTICAFCWKRISALRLARCSPDLAPTTMCRFKRTIDGRAALGIPLSYLGHTVYFAITQLPLKQVVSLPLSTIAQALRRDLNAANTAWAVRSYATFLAREPDKSKLLYGGPHNPNIDLGATTSIFGLEDPKEVASAFPGSFGPLLGSYRFFRRPYLAPMPGSITIGPAEHRSIPVVVCLPETDLEDLKGDPEWRQYMRYVG